MSVADVELLGRWMRRRDPDAFRALVTRHASMVYATCRRVLGNAVEAEDVAQECFETLAFLANPPEGHLGAWLHRVATNRSLDRVKTERRRRDREARFASGLPESSSIAWDDVYPLVDEAIASLPDDVRVPLVAAYLEGQSHRTIGKTLGIPRRTVTHRIAQGVEAIRADLVRRGVPVGAAALAAIFGAHMVEAAPAALVAQLGRIALSGVGSSTGAGGVGGGAWLAVGGLIMAKKLGMALAVAFVLVFASVWWFGNSAKNSRTDVVAREEPIDATIPETAVADTQTDAVVDTGFEPAVDAVVDQGLDVPEEHVSPARVEGTVLDDAGYPLEGARVRLEVADDGMGFHVVAAYETSADANGAFAIENVTRFGACNVMASREGYVPASPRSVKLAAGGVERNVDFVLAKGRYYISGNVVDAQHRPVPGAEVQLRYYRMKWPSDGRFFSGAAKMAAVFTDANGYFSMAIPRRANCDFSVVKAGYGTGYFPGIGTGTDDATFVLQPGGAIAGRVTTTDGDPVRGATVTAQGAAALSEESEGMMPSRVAAASASTDENGHYEIAGLGADFVYTVTAGYSNTKAAPRTDITVTPHRTRAGVDFQLEELAPAWIRGTVTDRWSGLPASGIRVYVTVLNDGEPLPGDRSGSAESGEDGTYLLSLALSREARIELRWQYLLDNSAVAQPQFSGIQPSRSDAGEDGVVQTITLRPGAGATVDFSVPAPVTITVLFVDSKDRPMAGVDVAICHDGAEWGRVAVTGADGRATYNGLTPGATYRVRAYVNTPERVRIGESEPFTGAPGARIEEVVVVCTPKGGLEGCLRDSEGHPVSNTEIGCTAVLADGSVLDPSTTTTGDDGCFVILYSLPEGMYDTVGVGYVRDDMIYRGLIEHVTIARDQIVDLGAIVCEPVLSVEDAERIAGEAIGAQP